MEEGRFIQVGQPKEVYEYPVNRFVADFIGNINLFGGRVESSEGKTAVFRSDDTGSTLYVESDNDIAVNEESWLAVRPEKIFISPHEPENTDDVRLRGIVEDLGYFGNLSLVPGALAFRENRAGKRTEPSPLRGAFSGMG